VVVSFAGYGLYTYEPVGEIWQQINPLTPDEMICQGNGIAVDYGFDYGLWSWSLADGWQQRNPVDPGQMVAVDIDDDGLEELVVSFPGYGLYTYEPEDGTWDRINTEIPEGMIRQGNGIAVDFGAAYGLYVWSQEGGWVLRNPADPGQMVAVDIDSDGIEELVVAFSGYGLYSFGETNAWQVLHYVVPMQIVPIYFRIGYIKGKVSDPDGVSVDGALLRLNIGNATALTTSEGYYLMCLPAGTYTVTVEAEGYLPESRRVILNRGSTITLNFTISRGTSGSN
jgi:hypothetical protein